MKNKIITIPNMLTLFRIILIPVFVWAYCFKCAYSLSFGILLVSGITDIADGFIARHFNLISPLGKALDPIADKLTQLTVLLCLCSRFPEIIFLAVFLVIKEVVSGVFLLRVIHKTKKVYGADWHGKIVTWLLDITMLLHVLWWDIPGAASLALVCICMGAMAVSFVLYIGKNVKLLKGEAPSGK